MVNAKFTPEYNLRVHLIITRSDVLALSSTDRSMYVLNKFVPVLNHVNQIYQPTGIQFSFDPAIDVEYNAQAETVDGQGLQEIAQQYIGKVAVFHRGHGGNAGSRADFFHVQDLDGDNFAHEMGHFLYLPHTFVEKRKLSDLPPLIKEGIEANPAGQAALAKIAQLRQGGVPPETALGFDVWESLDALNCIGTRILNELTDGDSAAMLGADLGIADTPPALHEYKPGKASDKKNPGDEPDGYEYCRATFPISVQFSNGYTHAFEFTPDMHNVMGYGHFGGCTPRYFSNDQVKMMRNGISVGGRRHLTEAPLQWSGWSELPGGGTANTAVTAASLGKRIYVFSKGIQNNRIYVNSAEDGFSFGNWAELPGGATADVAPAAASLGKRIYVICKGIQNNRIYVNSAEDGFSFGNWVELPGGATTDVAPAAASLGKRIYVVCKGIQNNRIYVNSAEDGTAFGSWAEIPGNGTADTALAAASLGKRLYVIGKGIQNKRIYVNSAVDGSPFGNWEQIPGEMKTNQSLATASFGNRLFVFAVGIDGYMYYVTAQDGKPFGKWIEIPKGGKTNAPMATATLGQRIYVFCKGMDNKIYANSAKLI